MSVLNAHPGHRRKRPGLDALRGLTTLLVVLHHTAITYGAIGGWYYREMATTAQWPFPLLVFFCTVNQAWFMGLFFLLAGYFTPPALARRGARQFIAGRLLRLGLPLLVYGLLIGPATIALAATARGQAFIGTFTRLVRHGEFESGPLWFVQALLLMTAAAMAWWALHGSLPGGHASKPSAPAVDANAWPKNSALTIGALATGAVAWVLRQWWPIGTTVWGLQLGYFASYVVLFAFGCRAAQSAWLERIPLATVKTWWRVAKWSLPVLPALYFLGTPWPGLRGPVMQFAYAFWEPLVAWGVLLKLVYVFNERVKQPARILSALSRRAFVIYVIHPPVLVGVALAWSGLTASPLLKFAVTGAAACVLCFLLAGALLRLPALARVL